MSEKTPEINREEFQKQEIFPKSPTREMLESIEVASSVSVRDVAEIPKRVFNYFKVDPKTDQPLSEASRILAAQSYMHELDEGVRVLALAGKREEVKFFIEKNVRIHLNNLIVLLREWLADSSVTHLSPEKVSLKLKIRNNQIGKISSRFLKGKVVGFTSEGILYKNRNEDALLVYPERGILAVLDGMGGHAGGNIASGIGVDFLEYGLKKQMPLEKAIEYANEAILQRTKSDPRLSGKTPMGTTLVSCEIRGDDLKSLHSGDSKLMVIRKGKVVFETKDHTNGQDLLRTDVVDLETAHFLNHILSRSLGCDSIFATRDLEKSEMKLKSGDRVLLASDGITDNFFNHDFSLPELAKLAGKGEIEEACQNIFAVCKERIQKGHLPNGYASKGDNITLLIYEHG